MLGFKKEQSSSLLRQWHSWRKESRSSRDRAALNPHKVCWHARVWMLRCWGMNEWACVEGRQMPRGMGSSSAVIINISSSWSHASDPGTAAAPARTVQLTRINITFSLRYRHPCNFLCPSVLYRHTQLRTTKFLCESSNLHQLHTRKKRATITTRIREMQGWNPGREVDDPEFFSVSVLSYSEKTPWCLQLGNKCVLSYPTHFSPSSYHLLSHILC